MKNNQVERKHQWFSIEQRLAHSKPELVLEWTTESFVMLVDYILNGKHYDELKYINADELRLKHLKEVNKEYQACVEKLTAMIQTEGSETNETTSINSAGQTNCEKVS